jgi:hypothetical protein
MIIMKTRNSLSTPTLVLTIAMTGTATAAANLSTGSLGTDVLSAIGSGNVCVILQDGVATLTGIVETQVDANAAMTAAVRFQGVRKVINQISVSD